MTKLEADVIVARDKLLVQLDHICDNDALLGHAIERLIDAKIKLFLKDTTGASDGQNQG